ncbi:MAG: hypothetical protein H0W01_04385 [Pseudonocardiales bacterium]|nr:hypothetical protein [Pseudonocardiales bacterium]
MPSPTARSFAALARSSPWRWRSVRFVLRRSGYPGYNDSAVRGWIRRPAALRVEQLDGTLITAEAAQGGPGRPYAVSVDVDLDADGLVTRRPDRYAWHHDDPMYQDYQWVAMLDPVELADGYDTDGGRRESAPPVRIDEIREVEHHGRPAWEALMRPTDSYDPRCSCCPLLFSAQSVARSGSLAEHMKPADPRYADAHRVRLDVGTGICVRTEEVGGDFAGRGHDVAIETVDEPFPDGLFTAARRRRRG